ELPPGSLRAEALSRLAIVRLYGEGFSEMTHLLQRALREVDEGSPLRVQILITLSYSLLNTNKGGSGLHTAEEAVANAERLGQPHLLSMALMMRVVQQFLSGAGLDEDELQRALDLEDPDVLAPLVFRPNVQHALLLAWTGQLDEADEKLRAIRHRCV